MTTTLLAPAKINLSLRVLGKRADGYHELAMLMQQVALYDRISLTLNDTGGVRVLCAGLSLAEGEENIAAKAARLLLQIDNRGRGVDIIIDKQIPVAAGLGGGSSDAATVLCGLNDLLGLGLDRARLQALGGTLGADVPFFIFGPTAWATGIGASLAPVPPLPAACYVLVNPGLSVSTAWVYQNLRLTSPDELAKIPGFSSTAQALADFLHNDLERVTCTRYPVVDEIKQTLLRLGALGALMSGSGPTVFGLFADRAAADVAAEILTAGHPWRVFVAGPL